jgi:hypothetical protein
MQGTYSYKGKVDDSYDCFQERTELTQSDVGKRFYEGEENWEAFGIWIGQDMNITRDVGGPSTMFQHKPVPSNNPNTSIKIGSSIFQWTTQGGTDANPTKDAVTVGNITKGEWHRFIVHTKYEKDNTGMNELFSDVPGGPGGSFVQIGTTQNKPTMFTTDQQGNTLSGNSIRVNSGFYRDASDSGTESFAQDGYTVGSTCSVVAQNAFGTVPSVCPEDEEPPAASAPEIVAGSPTSTIMGPTTGNLEVTMPATVGPDDILFVHGKQNSATANLTALPAGWNEVAIPVETVTGSGYQFYAWKAADGTEDGTTVTFTSSNTTSAFLGVSFAISGAHQTAPVDVATSNVQTPATTAFSADGVTTTGDNRLVMYFGAVSASSTFAWTSPATEVYDMNPNASTNRTSSMASKVQAAAGATGAGAATMSASAISLDATVAIKAP